MYVCSTNEQNWEIEIHNQSARYHLPMFEPYDHQYWPIILFGLRLQSEGKIEGNRQKKVANTSRFDKHRQ